MNTMDTRFSLRNTSLIAIMALALSWLTGCAPLPSQHVPADEALAPKSNVQFIDLQSFDHDLFTSMNAALPVIDVTFYDKVTPNELPVRLQNWMVSVEAGGGKVKVIPPPSTVTTRSPLLLIGLVTSLWTANKMAKEVSNAVQLKKAGTYDAEIRLKTDDSNNHTVVDKVVFIQRKS